MPDPQGTPIRVDVPGVGVVEFPAGTTPAQMEASLVQYKAKPEVAQRSTGEDVAIGAGKGFGGNMLNLAQLAASINPSNLMMKAAGVPERFQMGYVPPEITKGYKPTNKPQQVGDMLQTVASIAAGPAIAGLSRAGALGSTTSKAAPAVAAQLSGGGPATMTPEAVADWLATVGASSKAAPVASAIPAAAKAQSARSVLTEGALQAAKYGIGGTAVDALRRLLSGGK